MVEDFVLIDAIHGREEDILEELDQIPSVLVARQLPHKVTNHDILALAEGDTQNDIRSLLANELSRVDGVYTVRKDHEDFVDEELENLMEEMEAEALQA